MKIVLTGSIGHISKPLAEELVKKGHTVTIISSNPEKKSSIESLGAIAAIGQVTDSNFLASVFKEADAAYLMIPPNYAAPDPVAYYRSVGDSYAEAIRQSGLKKAVNLSSYGAHVPKGTGFITGSYEVEQILSALPDVSITFVRPTYFYYNLNNFIQVIKATGAIAANYGGPDKIVLVAPADIATVVAEELTSAASGHKVRYICSDERTGNEIASVLGKEIGLPNLKWNILTDEQMLESLTGRGVPKHVAENLVELGAALRTGLLSGDYELHKPVLSNTKLETFAKEFAKTYHQS